MNTQNNSSRAPTIDELYHRHPGNWQRALALKLNYLRDEADRLRTISRNRRGKT